MSTAIRDAPLMTASATKPCKPLAQKSLHPETTSANGPITASPDTLIRCVCVYVWLFVCLCLCSCVILLRRSGCFYVFNTYAASSGHTTNV